MGRKSERVKEKKQKKLKDEEREAQILAAVEAANSVGDPMETLSAFKSYARHGLNVSISCQRASSLDSSTLDWALDLTRANMRALYEASEWGWNGEEKKAEMRDDKAWYLIVRDREDPIAQAPSVYGVDPTPQAPSANGVDHTDGVDHTAQAPSADGVDHIPQAPPPRALVHFRFDVEDECAVLYCYEIQLDTSVRRKGLGKFLMQTLELIAFRAGMQKVMLTVFRHNTEAQQFFVSKLRYTVDETSPVISVEDAMFDDLQGSTYQILSKPIKTLVGPLATPAAPIKSLVGSQANGTQPIKTVIGSNKTSAS